MMGIGVVQIIIMGLVGLLLFGHRLPAVMRSLGSSLHAFKEGLNEDQNLLP